MKRAVIKHSQVETGVTVYNREVLDEVEHEAGAAEVVNTVIKEFNSTATAELKSVHRLVDIFKFLKEGKCPKRDLTEFVLPEGVEPHGPILQFAKAGIVDYGFNFAASVDTSKSSISNRATDHAVKELGDLAGTRSFGLIFVVQRQEDLFNPRIERLRQEVGEIAVPSMHILTLPGPEIPPIEQGSQHRDPDPGMATLG